MSDRETIDPKATPTVGDVLLGKYEITRVLGAGGMGMVVAARHLELGELVALKFLLPEMLGNVEVRERFSREARAATRIKNEHVARVLDVGTLPTGAPFIVMEHLSGADLAAKLRERGPFRPQEAVDLLLQACEAIAEAHALGIVHRDLKPANLFLTHGSDGMPVVKVLDFGISKSTSPTSVVVTSTTAVLGSPLYMSPEQLASTRDVDARTDVWSLGVILYELLAGLVPFEGETFPALCAHILGGAPVPLETRRADLPPGLTAAVAAALVRDPNRRTPDVDAFARSIGAFASAHGHASLARIGRIHGLANPHAPPRASVHAFERTEALAPSGSTTGPAPYGPPPGAGTTNASMARSVARDVASSFTPGAASGDHAKAPTGAAPARASGSAAASWIALGVLLLLVLGGGGYALRARRAPSKLATAPLAASALPAAVVSSLPSAVTASGPSASEPSASASAGPPPSASGSAASRPPTRNGSPAAKPSAPAGAKKDCAQPYTFTPQGAKQWKPECL